MLHSVRRSISRVLAFFILLCFAPALATAQDRAEAAAKPPLSIAVFVSSRNDQCFDQGDIAAITKLATAEQDRINAQGGVAGRLIRLQILDDQRDQAKTIANLRQALSDPATAAMVGLSNTARAKAAFDALGAEISNKAIPFLSSISVSSIFEKYPNVFTMQASQEDERLPAITAFLRENGARRIGYLGLKDVLFSSTLGDGLKQRLPADQIVTDLRLAASDTAIDPTTLLAAIAEIRTKQAETLIVGFGGTRLTQLLKSLIDAGTTPALFVTGRIETLPAEITAAYPNAIYQLAWDRLPEAYNDRLHRVITKGPLASWVFEGRKVEAAPGWASGQCKARPEAPAPDPFTDANLRAVEIGTQYADMVAMIAAAAAQTKAGTDIPELRRDIARRIAKDYAAGRGTYKGPFDNWSFHAHSRAAVRTPFVVMLPQGLGRTQLAPNQFMRIKDGSLRRIDTLYVDIDLIRSHRVDDNEKTFFAEFYLSMRGNPGASIDRIDFTNAFLDPRTSGRQITIEMLHGGGNSDAYPASMRIYKVAGRFVFEPELGNYPFDTQRFSIDIQPKRGDAPFIIQAPPASLRDQQVATDGWNAKTQYVGYDEDFVPVVDAYTHQPSVAPFYKASFVWMMKRQTTDYYLRVVVPLAFILIVAYLSIFIPHSHFEAIVTIQVTALLSAVALYLSLPKLDSDAATLSDRIFVFNYLLVSLMIVISIMRVNGLVATRGWLKASLGALHVCLIPVLVAAMAFYIHTLSLAE